MTATFEYCILLYQITIKTSFIYFFFWRKNDQLKLKSSFGLFSFNQCFFLVSFKLGFQWIGFDSFLLVNWSKNRLSWARGTCVLGLFFVHAAFHNNGNKNWLTEIINEHITVKTTSLIFP